MWYEGTQSVTPAPCTLACLVVDSSDGLGLDGGLPHGGDPGHGPHHSEHLELGHHATQGRPLRASWGQNSNSASSWAEHCASSSSAVRPAQLSTTQYRTVPSTVHSTLGGGQLELPVQTLGTGMWKVATRHRELVTAAHKATPMSPSHDQEAAPIMVTRISMLMLIRNVFRHRYQCLSL